VEPDSHPTTRLLEQMDASSRERLLLAGVRVLVSDAKTVLCGTRASNSAPAIVWLHSTSARDASVPLSLAP